MPLVSERFRLPRSIEARTWAGLHSGLWKNPPRGMVARDDMTIAPAWTCREAIAVIQAMRAAAGAAAFPFWYQFAALGYGWDPARDVLHGSRRQADSYYPADAAVLLHLELQRVTSDLDDAQGAARPRIDLEPTTFDDEKFRDEVAIALRHDGALAYWSGVPNSSMGDDPEIKMPVPLPACKDPNTGKPVMPKLNPKTGKFECPGGVVVIDDPITAIVKSLAVVVVPVAIIVIAVAIANMRSKRGRK